MRFYVRYEVLGYPELQSSFEMSKGQITEFLNSRETPKCAMQAIEAALMDAAVKSGIAFVTDTGRIAPISEKPAPVTLPTPKQIAKAMFEVCVEAMESGVFDVVGTDPQISFWEMWRELQKRKEAKSS